MDFKAKLDKLLKLSIPNLPGASVLEASYENNGSFSPSEEIVIEGLPPFYRVFIEIKSESGISHTELWLPESWNNIFVGTGNGGMAGKVSYWSLPGYLKNGYAAANTDMGTCRGRSSGVGNPDVWKDFGWRATHQMTECSKFIIKEHYGISPEYSYFIGGSTGGQQGLSEAQRFPLDYDGIVAGVPANNRTMLHTYFLWNHVHLRTPEGRKLFTDEETVIITDCATEFFRNSNGGLPHDNFISFPQSSPELTDAFLKALQHRHPGFTSEQLAALRAVYSGPVNPRTGERIYNGMPIGSEIYGCGIKDCQQSESPHYYPFIWTFGENYSPYSFDFDKDTETLNNTLSADLNANSPDISGFKNHGGKLLIYSGSADPCVPFPDAMCYYERVAERFGGYEGISDFCRYFLIPGRDHGSGGRGANAFYSSNGGGELEIIRRWREQNTPPDSLKAVRYRNTANHSEGVELERFIYPYLSERFPACTHPPVCCDAYLR